VSIYTTIVLRIEHTVGNFDSWKAAFDSDPIGRQKLGVRSYRILRPTNDPNYVMIDLEFDDLKEAEDFRSELRNLWDREEAQKVLLMENFKVRIVEQLEAKEY
jgi:hypothetical protein